MDAADYPCIRVSDDQLPLLCSLADGTLSPLVGPMNQEDCTVVLESRCIHREGRRFAWTIPVVLPVDSHEARNLRVGGHAMLVGSVGVLGRIRVESIFRWDKAAYSQAVLGTCESGHPGVETIMADSRTWLLGGEIWLLPAVALGVATQLCTPRISRARIGEYKWEAALAMPLWAGQTGAGLGRLLDGLHHLTGGGIFAGAGLLLSSGLDAHQGAQLLEPGISLALAAHQSPDHAYWQRLGYTPEAVFGVFPWSFPRMGSGGLGAVMTAIACQNHGFSHFLSLPVSQHESSGDGFRGAHDRMFRELSGELAITQVSGPVGDIQFPSGAGPPSQVPPRSPSE